MTVATKPGAPFQGPSWAEVAADPSTLRHDPTGRGGTGKKYSEDQIRDFHGRWVSVLTPVTEDFGAHRDGTWDFDPRDSRTEREALLSNPAAQRTRAEFPSGTRVVSVGTRRDPQEGQHGSVDRTVPSGDSLGGRVRVIWDNVVDGFVGTVTPNSIVREDEWNARAQKSKDFNEELHPRDDHGRFTDTGSLGDTAINQGGFSLSLAGDRPRSGWMVSQLGSERSFSIEQLASGQSMDFVPGNPWHDNFTSEVDRFVSDHLDDLQAKGAYLGGWVDSGRLFLDVSYNFADRGEAEQFARENQQFAMFNAGTGGGR